MNRNAWPTFAGIHKKINFYRSSLSIPFYEIENALFSKRLNEIERVFERLKITVDYKSEEKKSINKLSDSKIVFKEEYERDSNKYKRTSLQKFKEGILEYEDIKFIAKQKIKLSEITKYADGTNTTLPSIEVFSIYPLEEVRQSLNEIIHHSLTGKTNSEKFFHHIFYHPGNVLALIEKYGDGNNFEKATKSFGKFMSLSLFEISI